MRPYLSTGPVISGVQSDGVRRVFGTVKIEDDGSVAFEAPAGVADKPVALKKVWSYDCNPPEFRFRDGKPIRYTLGDARQSSRTASQPATCSL